MNRSRLLIVALLLVATACSRDETSVWHGYAEGEYVYVAAPRSGRLQELTVRKGGEVAAGAPLFRLDPEPEATVVAEAQRRLEQSGFRRTDLGRGERPSEIAALEARREQAVAARDLTRTELTRRERLFADGVIPREQLDQLRSRFDQQQAAVAELEARLVTARLGGRHDQRQALSAEVAALAAQVRQAEWALAEKSPAAPVSGLVFDTLYEVGELVPANAPVVTILPPQGRKARFYVPEPQLAALSVGSKVQLRFDGGTVAAAVSYVSPQAEYTPPVIYSRESRDKLVFLVEARPEPAQAALLKPGQPLEVVPQ